MKLQSIRMLNGFSHTIKDSPTLRELVSFIDHWIEFNHGLLPGIYLSDNVFKQLEEEGYELGDTLDTIIGEVEIIRV